MTVDPLLSLLVGALGAAALGLLGAWIQGRREHTRWLRERRLDAYSAFMVDMNTFYDVATTEATLQNALGIRKRLASLAESLQQSGEAVSLLGPLAVNRAGQEWIWTALKLSSDGSESTSKEAWKSARWQFLIEAGKVFQSKNVGPIPLEESPSP